MNVQDNKAIDSERDIDVVVAGGGPAGVAAAIQAARDGAHTLLVERYGRLGGAATNCCVGPLMGGVESPFVTEVERRFKAIGNNWEYLDLLYADMIREAGAELLLHCWATDVIREGQRVNGIRAVTKQGVLNLTAKVVVDATGDGDLAAAAGAEFEVGRPEDGLLQPVSIMFRLGGVDKTRALLCGGEREAVTARVPAGSWHDVVAAGIAAGELPPTVGVIRLYEAPNDGERIVNATQVNGIDGTCVADLTRAELEGRRQVPRVVDFLRRHAPGYEKCFVSQMPAVIGVRETRRVLGEDYLTREDLIMGRERADAVVRRASFVIDIHNPAGAGQARGFAETVKPYDIPYGCLVPRSIDGLLMAGRCISGSHEAHASYRVQRIVMAIGAAAGAAAAIAVLQDIQPRRISAGDVQRRLGLRPAAM